MNKTKQLAVVVEYIYSQVYMHPHWIFNFIKNNYK